jgi:DNA gyrase/topoisomerase IV subunit A
MDTLIPKLYREYGQYSNWRAFPLSVDGLKPVERRILYSAYQIARTRFTKSARVDGHVIGNYHPHGSVYGSIVQLVRQGFLEGQGSFGGNIGVEPVGPAASRYTEIRMEPLTLDIAFRMIENVPWFVNELDQKEPVHLPAMFPLCLIGRDFTQGIGFGYKTFVPFYDVSELQKRLEYLIGIRKRKVIIEPMTDCTILSDREVLDELLTTGKAKIDVEGKYEIDHRTNTLFLYSWPPGRKFESILKKFQSDMIGFTDLSEQGQTKIAFQVLRERNRDKIFKEFIDNFKESVQGSISFEIITIDLDNNVRLKSVDEMLLDTFNRFKEVNQETIKKEMLKTEREIAEFVTLQIIRKPLSDCLKQEMEIEATIKYVAKITKIAPPAIRELFTKYRISKLLTIDTDTTELEQRNVELKERLKNLDEFVINQYQSRFK